MASTFALRRSLTRPFSSAPPALPWFVDPVPQKQRPAAPNFAPPPPADAPIALRDLHAELAQSPFLDTSRLLLTRPLAAPLGPLLPLRQPNGRRRKRRGTIAGETEYDIPGGLWSWLLFAQVKVGTETKGSIDSIVRIVRKSLLTREPPLTLPANAKRRMHNGWAFIDAGDYAIHVMSKATLEKYFEHVVDGGQGSYLGA